jgi:uncharacterized membrane protein
MPMPANASRIVPSGTSIGLELRPYRSLDARGARYFLLGVAIAAFVGAGIAALNGAWPALIFAAIEVFAVAFALRLNMRPREDLHEVRIDERNVTVEIKERGRSTVAVLPRYWTRVRLDRPHDALERTHLYLECHGKVYEIGYFLNEPELLAAERLLVSLIGPRGCAPDLQARLESMPSAALTASLPEEPA